MAILETLRFGLVRWTAERDQFTRVQMDDTHENIEQLVGKFTSGSATPSLPNSEYVRAFFYNTSTEDLLYSHDGVSWSTIVEGVDPVTLTGSQTLKNKTLTSPSFPQGVLLPGGSQINTTYAAGSYTYAGQNATETLKHRFYDATFNNPLIESCFERRISATSPNANTIIQIGTKNSQSSFHFFESNSTTNFSLNIVASIMPGYLSAGYLSAGTIPLAVNDLLKTGESITVGVAVTNGSTAYYPTALLIDGNSQPVLWADGSAPTAGNANSIDVYLYTIVKMGNANFKVYAQQNQFA